MENTEKFPSFLLQFLTGIWIIVGEYKLCFNLREICHNGQKIDLKQRVTRVGERFIK